MPRVHQGLKNGRMGLWVSAPGHDASSESAKFLLNSDWQFMRLHQQGFGTVSATASVDPLGRFLYNDFTITFPDLGYKPMAILSNSPPATPGFMSPWYFSDCYIYSNEDVDQSESKENNFFIYNDRLVVSPGYVYGNTMNYSYIVFKNRLL